VFTKKREYSEGITRIEKGWRYSPCKLEPGRLGMCERLTIPEQIILSNLFEIVKEPHRLVFSMSPHVYKEGKA